MTDKHECGPGCDHTHDPKVDLQNKFTELQMISQQMQQIQKQMQQLDAQLQEVQFIEESLDDFGNIKNGNEILVPLSNGIFAKAELKDNTTLLVNTGSDTIVNKSVADTKAMITQQGEGIRNVRVQMAQALEHFTVQAKRLQEDIQNIKV